MRVSFSIFGREIWSLNIDREEDVEILEWDDFIQEDDEEDEDEEEDEEDEETLRWGEPACFNRTIFSP